jgi:hypothetical protein
MCRRTPGRMARPRRHLASNCSPSRRRAKRHFITSLEEDAELWMSPREILMQRRLVLLHWHHFGREKPLVLHDGHERYIVWSLRQPRGHGCQPSLAGRTVTLVVQPREGSFPRRREARDTIFHMTPGRGPWEREWRRAWGRPRSRKIAHTTSPNNEGGRKILAPF